MSAWKKPKEDSYAGKLIYDDLRAKWVHEDDLVNQRITWLLTSQAFLLTAFGVLALLRIGMRETYKDISPSIGFFSPFSLAELIMPSLSIRVTRFLSDGVEAAFIAMSEIKSLLKHHQTTGRVWSGFKVDVHTHATLNGQKAANGMTKAFTHTWSILACYEMLRSIAVCLYSWLPDASQLNDLYLAFLLPHVLSR